jgi:hypothetical protein
MRPRGQSGRSVLDRAPLPGWVRVVLENPIVVREWRVLRRRGLDWRIWIGVKWSLDPVVWGAPVVLSYAVAPYALWMVLGVLRGLRLVPTERLPVDPFLMVLIVFGVYMVSICLVLGATAVTHEREQQTWEQLWLTLLTGRERAAGFYWGRLGPALVALLATMGAWWLLQPHFAALLRPFWPEVVPRETLAIAALAILLLSLIAGLIGLFVSSLSRRTWVAVACASVALWHAGWVGFSMLPLIFMASFAFWGAGSPTGSVTAILVGLIGVGLAGLFVWGLWQGTASALTRHPVPLHHRAPDAGRETLNARRATELLHPGE